MLQQNLKLVGLAVALAIVGISSGWTIQAQEGMTLDPGTVVTEDANQQSLLAEALAAMIRAGYDPKDFDFEKAVFDPLERAVFLPVRASEEVLQQAQALVQNEQRFLLVGLLYARQPFEFQAKRYGRGLHPIRVTLSTQVRPTNEETNQAIQRRPTLLNHGGPHVDVGVQCGVSLTGRGIDCVVGLGVRHQVPLPPGSPGPSPGDLVSSVISGIVQLIADALHFICAPIETLPNGSCPGR